QSHPGAREAERISKNAQYFRESERHQREIGAAQPVPEAQPADDRAHDPARNAGKQQREPGIDPELQLQDRAGIGARAKEAGMAEGELHAIPAENVPGLAKKPVIAREHGEIEPEI